MFSSIRFSSKNEKKGSYFLKFFEYVLNGHQTQKPKNCQNETE